MASKEPDKKEPDKNKIFQDTVHGSIPVPDRYCRHIIDTRHFQRLRRVEQTSMRAIFPCASHNRFIHSLGTFYIGNKIFDNIRRNSEKELTDITAAQWDKIGESYKLACLLHDCGHAPFSHTFEKYYDKPTQLEKKLAELITDPQFHHDISSGKTSKEHEKVSAIVAYQIFGSALKELYADPELVVRMIIGCKYLENGSQLSREQMLRNCFITLLNGNVVDADRLDYAKRDKWMSGYSTSGPDIERLLSTLRVRIHDGGVLKVCFHQNAISEIQNLLEARDYQSSWIFSHHKVTYDNYLLDKAVALLAQNLNPRLQREKAIGKLFNVDSFLNEKYCVGKKVMLYLPCDDDIVYLLKNDVAQNPYAEEWLSRTHELKPLWKSYAEFRSHFFCGEDDKKVSESNYENGRLRQNIESVLKEMTNGSDWYHVELVNVKGNATRTDEVFVWVNDNIKKYDELIVAKGNRSQSTFFYAYIHRDLIDKKMEVIQKVIAKSQ